LGGEKVWRFLTVHRYGYRVAENKVFGFREGLGFMREANKIGVDVQV